MADNISMFSLTFKSLQTLFKHTDTEINLWLVKCSTMQLYILVILSTILLKKYAISNTTENNTVNEQALASKEGEKM